MSALFSIIGRSVPATRVRRLGAVWLALLLCVSASAASESDDRWTLTSADFSSRQVVLTGMDSAGLHVRDDRTEAPRTVPFADFLEIRRNAPAVASGSKFCLRMIDGDRLDGEPVRLTADALLWKNGIVGEIAVPTARLVAITPSASTPPPSQGHEDVVALRNGDSVHGIVANLTGDRVTVQTSAGNSDVPLVSVASVSFASTPGGAAASRGFRIRLDDGSSLVGSEVRLAGTVVTFTLSRGSDRSVPLARVAAFEQVNGPVSWLSSRAPSEEVHYPFIGPAVQPGAYMDRDWTGGGPIEFEGRQFGRGIGVHAYSRISWPLDGRYAAVRTRYAVDGDSALADVTVRIRLDDRVVYEKKNFRAGILSDPVILPLGSARTLTFEVDGSAAYAQDGFNWIEPALLREMPAIRPASATAP